MSMFSGESGVNLALFMNELFEQYSEEGEVKAFKKKISQLDEIDKLFVLKVLSKDISDDEIQSFISNSKNKIPICGALFKLETEIEKTNNKKLMLACLELVKDSSVSSYFDENYFGAWEWPFFKNKNLQPNDIEMLWNICSHNYPIAYGTPARDVAKHKNTPITVLKILYELDNEEPLRKAIALHTNLDEELTMKFLNSNIKSERLALAKSKYVDLKVLKQLSNDNDEDVQFWALENIKKRSD